MFVMVHIYQVLQFVLYVLDVYPHQHTPSSCSLSVNSQANGQHITHSPVMIPHLPTHSMEQSPSREANWFSTRQDVLHILWNSKVH
jgi:hypothetical protein